jgi:hypothetical protein
MASRFLPVILKNALLLNQEALPRLLGGKLGARRVLDFCENHRVLAIGSLLLTGRSKHFFYFLPQSGRAFAHYLANAGAAGLRLSLYAPFFDAVGAGDFEGAADIARRSRRTWAQGEEYEEDFLFVDFLMRHFFLDAPMTECEDLLARYERALQGAEDVRLALCTALLQGDSEAFNAALAQYLAERKASQDERRETSVLSEEEKATWAHVSIEALALVRLAERKGLETEEEYLFIPSIAREASKVRVEAAAWTQLSLESLPAQALPKKS